MEGFVRGLVSTVTLLLACVVPAWAQEFVPDANTSLLLHFNSSLASTDGRQPTGSSGVTFEPGVFANGAFLAGEASLSYDSSVLTPSAGTIEFWIKPRWPGNDGQTHIMLSVPGKLVINKDGFANFRFVLGADDSEAYQAWNLSAWQANEWHHIAVVWQIPGFLRTYIDGVQSCCLHHRL
jgi:hypothetical protein